jgi:hypothetical protein
MSADNMIYFQRCPDGKWRAWEGFASDDNPVCPAKGFVVEKDTRDAAILAAFDYSKTHYTEYGVVELEPDDGPPDEDTLHWHALNFRTAHTLHADDMWKALEAYVSRQIAAERERCAAMCDNVAADCDSWDEGGSDGRTAANMCAAAIRSSS